MKKGWISMDSPMGRSLLGKSAGDDVLVERPIGDTEIHIIAVNYEPFEETNR